MDSSSFICALGRFAIRGLVAKITCDQGTNFVGGKSQLEDALLEMDQTRIQKFTAEQGCEWVFNPPHASHFGSVWDRQIGMVCDLQCKRSLSQLRRSRNKVDLWQVYGPTCIGHNATEDRANA